MIDPSRRLRAAATDDKLGLASNTSRYRMQIEGEQNLKPFEISSTEISLKITLISAKAIGVAKSISEIFQKTKLPAPAKEATKCSCCGKNFVVLIRKKVKCFVCEQLFCTQ